MCEKNMDDLNTLGHEQGFDFLSKKANCVGRESNPDRPRPAQVLAGEHSTIEPPTLLYGYRKLS